MLTIKQAGAPSQQGPYYYTPGGDTAHDLAAKGEAAFNQGNLQEARQHFERALQRAPFDARLHCSLSTVLWSQGDAENALNCMMRAMELDPDDRDVILNCVSIFRKFGKKDDAREVLEAYLAKKPWDFDMKKELDGLEAPSSQGPGTSDLAELFSKQGEEQFSRGRMVHAKVCFELALDHEPRHAKAHSNLGVLLLQEGSLNEALEHLYKALDLNAADPDILYNSAKALEVAGEISTAMEYMRLYLQQNPADEAAWEDYADLARQAGAFWRPDSLSGEVTQVYLRMGSALAGAGDIVGAGEAFSRALQISPRQIEAIYELGKLYQAEGMTAEAIAMLKEAMEVDRSHRGAALELAKALSSAGRPGEARAVLQDYLAAGEDEAVRAALNGLGV